MNQLPTQIQINIHPHFQTISEIFPKIISLILFWKLLSLMLKNEHIHLLSNVNENYSELPVKNCVDWNPSITTEIGQYPKQLYLCVLVPENICLSFTYIIFFILFASLDFKSTFLWISHALAVVQAKSFLKKMVKVK